MRWRGRIEGGSVWRGVTAGEQVKERDRLGLFIYMSILNASFLWLLFVMKRNKTYPMKKK